MLDVDRAVDGIWDLILKNEGFIGYHILSTDVWNEVVDRVECNNYPGLKIFVDTWCNELYQGAYYMHKDKMPDLIEAAKYRATRFKSSMHKLQ